jgi:RimJ/RimL family protein N-acetyltransferase
MVLRFPVESDAPLLLEALEGSRDGILPWMVWARTENRTIGECHYTIERFRRLRERPECDAYAIFAFDRATGRMVGSSGLHHIEPGIRSVETGYWIRPELWNQGLATELTGALITSALTPQSRGGWGFRRLTILCAAANPGSASVARKLGLRLEQRTRAKNYLDPIGYYDTLGFAVLSEEWDFDAQRAKPGIAWPDGPIR